MGATSVTGVSGFGAADGNKGPDNRRNQFVPLRSPHIVAAGTVDGEDFSQGQIVVKVPGLTGNDYAILLSVEGMSSTVYVVSRDLTGEAGDDTTGNLESFVIAASGESLAALVVHWAISTVGV